jgi:hypothetical protein
MTKLLTTLFTLLVSSIFSQTIQIGIQAGYNKTQLYNKDDYSDKKSLLIKNSFAPSYGLNIGATYKSIVVSISPTRTSIVQNYTLSQDTGQRLHAKAFIKQNIYQVPI